MRLRISLKDKLIWTLVFHWNYCILWFCEGTVCQKYIYFSTVLIIFLKIIVGNSVCPQLLELQLEYIVLIYEKQTRVAFMYGHLTWSFTFYETILNVFRSIFVAFLKDQSTWHKPTSVKLCFCLWYKLKLSKSVVWPKSDLLLYLALHQDGCGFPFLFPVESSCVLISNPCIGAALYLDSKNFLW